jgi:plastocyanin
MVGLGRYGAVGRHMVSPRMNSNTGRSLRSAALLGSLLVLITAAPVSGQPDETDQPAMSVRVSGLMEGDLVSGEEMTLSVEPVGYELSPERVGSAPLDGIGHYHVHLDGALAGVYVTRDAIVILGHLAPGPHALTVMPAENDHTEVRDGAVTIGFDYEAGAVVPETVTISLREWSLDPSRLTLAPGTYTFVAPNDGAVDHSLVLAGDDVHAATPDAAYPSGVSQSFTVDLLPGTYEIFCPLPWHRTSGMVGEIVVES